MKNRNENNSLFEIELISPFKEYTQIVKAYLLLLNFLTFENNKIFFTNLAKFVDLS